MSRRLPLALSFAMNHFPEHKKIMETIYRQNESFRSLCKDFRDSVRAMEFWRNSPSDKVQASKLCEEYKDLYTDLKKEITKWLMEYNN